MKILQIIVLEFLLITIVFITKVIFRTILLFKGLSKSVGTAHNAEQGTPGGNPVITMCNANLTCWS